MNGRATSAKIRAHHGGELANSVCGSRWGTAACRNNASATGNTAKATTKRLTPPYVSTAQANTTAKTARVSPNRAVMVRAMERHAEGDCTMEQHRKTTPGEASGFWRHLVRCEMGRQVRGDLAQSARRSGLAWPAPSLVITHGAARLEKALGGVRTTRWETLAEKSAVQCIVLAA